MKSFFFRYISVTVYRIQENCEQNMFSALKNPKENKEKEKEWNKFLTTKGRKTVYRILTIYEDFLRYYIDILFVYIGIWEKTRKQSGIATPVFV